MSLKIDRIQLEVLINNDPARKALAELDQEAKKLKKALAKTTVGTKEHDEIVASLKQINVQRDAILDKMGIEKLTISELSRRQKELNSIMRNLDPSTQAYRDLEKQLITVNARKRELERTTRQTGFSLSNLSTGFNKYIGFLTAAAATITGLVMSTRKAIQAFADFDESVADVMKTTNLSRDQVIALNEDFKSIDTRSSIAELNRLAWIAGKLGIQGSADILGFVKAADIINVALKEDLAGNTEQVINKVGKLVQVFKLAEGTDGMEQAMIRVGSAINSLGMASAAAEDEIVDFVNRTSGIALMANITLPDLLALGATISSLPLTAETASTVYSRIMTEMAGNTAVMARFAGKSIGDFTHLVNTDANEAFIQLLEGLKGNDAALTEMVASFDELGIEGQRATSVIGVLIDNTKMLREQNVLSNTAFSEATSIINEFAIKNNTAQAQIDKNRKALRYLTIELGERLFPAITFSTSAFSYFIRAMLAAPRIFTEYRSIIILLVGSLLMLYSATIKYHLKLIYLNLTLKEGLLLRQKESIQRWLLIKQEIYHTALIGKYTIAAKAAAIATTTLAIAKKALGGPIGLAIGAITLFIALMLRYSNRAQESREIETQRQTALTKTRDVVVALSTETEKLNQSQGNLNLLTREQKIALRDNIQALIDHAKATLLSVKADQLAVEQQNTRLSGWQNFIKFLSLGFSSVEKFEERAARFLDKAKQKGKEAADDFNVQIDFIIAELDGLNSSLTTVEDHLKAESIADNILGDTLAKLQEKLSLYRLALTDVIIGSEEYIRISGKIAETQKQLSSANQAGLSTIKETIGAYELLSQKISDAQSALANFVAAGDFASAKEQALVLKSLERSKFVVDGIIAAGGSVQDFYSNLLAPSDKDKKIITDFIAELNDEISKTIDDEISATAVPSTPSLSPYEQFLRDSAKKQRDKELADKIESEKQWASARIEIAQSVVGASFDIFHQNLREQEQLQLSALHRERDAKLSNQRLTAKQREQIEADYQKKEAQIKQDAFRKQKTADIIQSIINTALAVTRALTTGNIASAIAAGVAGLAQTAVIINQKVPTFSTGNIVDVLGQDNKKYKAALTNQKHPSGLFGKPTFVPGFGIFGETPEPELVFNPNDTKLIMKSPALIAAIQHTIGNVRTFGQGNTKEIFKEVNNTVTVSELDPKIISLLERLETRLNEPLSANLVANENYIRTHNKLSDKYSTFTKNL